MGYELRVTGYGLRVAVGDHTAVKDPVGGGKKKTAAWRNFLPERREEINFVVDAAKPRQWSKTLSAVGRSPNVFNFLPLILTRHQCCLLKI